MAEPWWRRLLGTAQRVAGRPPSANGASSFHLRWELPGRFSRAAVTLEVLEPPTVPSLYFWALQVDLVDRSGGPAGGAHLGLQWHPGHPGSRAVNWGGYHRGGAVLDGTDSALPSATGNPHTRDLPWRAGVPYRLEVGPVPAGEPPVGPAGHTPWRGTVTDTATGESVVVRELFVPGDAIGGIVMWSEVFARCDDPSVAVRWSVPEAVSVHGEVAVPAAVRVNYQSHHDGGCANTDSSVDGVGLVQRTAVPRATPQGARLGVPEPGRP